MTDSKYVLESLLKQHLVVRDTLKTMVLMLSRELGRMTATTGSIIESLAYAGFITKAEQDKAVDKLMKQAILVEDEDEG